MASGAPLELFKGSRYHHFLELFSSIANLISEAGNLLLKQKPKRQEIKQVMFVMNPVSALSPDSFGWCFQLITIIVDIVEEDVDKAIRHFLDPDTTLPQSISSDSICSWFLKLRMIII
uniref:Uncharacterized protein n=1 Tax=Kalanchoe fedtschenkoi TaxID=63787 RepID=A0A7N0UNF9_KALFE